MIETLITRYGLLAIFAGAGIEGEAVVVAGGVMAGRGLVPVAGAMIAATLGSFMLDQLWFHAGRRFRHHPRIMRIAQKPAFARAERFIERHPRKFILAFRFIPGMRTVSPIAIGMSHVPTRLYVPLNFLAAAIWAPLLTSLGYWLGHRAAQVVTVISHIGLRVAGGGVAIAVVVGLGFLLRRWWRNRRAAE
ncbi:MAG: DedA family protein [Sphingomonadales bacterium]